MGRVAAALQEEASFYDFGTYGPIPAGFFGEGSDPFAQVVTFIGTPADPSGVYGDVDTQIEHGPVIFDPETGTATTSLDIITLELVSEAPITVTYGGANPEQWLVVAGLSPQYPGSGELTAALDSPDANSGTYDATVYVQPAFLFVKLQDLVNHVLPECVNMRVLDTGEPPPEAQGVAAAASSRSKSVATAGIAPITLTFTGQPFVRIADPAIVEQLRVPGCAQGNFVPGVIEFGGGGAVARAGQQLTCTSHITQGEAHYFCPPECQGPDVCKYVKSGSPTPVLCSQLPMFPSEMLGHNCVGGFCIPFAVKFKNCSGGGFAIQTYGSPGCVTRESTCKGACCTDQGGCVLSSAGLCEGTYMGDESQCGSVTCPKGACCHGGACSEKAPGSCTDPPDVYKGDGSTCNPNPCCDGIIQSVTVEAENGLTECMEGRGVTFTAKVQGTIPDSYKPIEYTFHFERADGTTWTGTVLSNQLQVDYDAVADNVRDGDTDHFFDTPIYAEAKLSACPGELSPTITVHVYELWIEKFKHNPTGKAWKVVVGEKIDYSAIASSDCTNWDWDMEDGFPDVWNPTGGNAKSAPPGSNMVIPNADLPDNDNWDDFGAANGTVNVFCEDFEENNHQIYSTDLLPAQTARVFFNGGLNTHPGGGSDNWFYYWKYALFGNIADVIFNGGIPYGSTAFDGSIEIGDAGNNDYATPYNHTAQFGYARPTADGKSRIDLFYSVLTHELQHRADIPSFIPGPDPVNDPDGDHLPSPRDPFPNTLNGAGFTEYTGVNAWRGDWEFNARAVENVTAPATSDWSKDGKQW